MNFYAEKYSLNNVHFKGRLNKQNQKEGFGEEISKDYNYTGNFYQDKKNGDGKIIYKDSKEIYVGNFINNALTGKGLYTWANGDNYTGDFINGKMHGTGEYLWPEGGKYVGEYINNIKAGKGIFHWTNGRIYEGEFAKGKPHGKGIINQNNKFYNVEFNDGKLVSKSRIKESESEDSKALPIKA